ncbi:MAG: hypothetical protein J0I15_13405 [Herbaspirillum huttiense]|uniref:hypothetical protein n=1 Tax=Herbaspirillum huttiense TaxID=863372 RepID=UPI001AD5B5CF|nr:hypothetical protein [Herbaspirillum huttiense]MBN9357444.1 hypothetical protein [Herbaspirillum huttiense]
MANDISALRVHLFETLAALRDKDNPMDIERAKAVSEVAQVIINTAKVEVEHARVTGGKGSAFLGDSKPELPPGITGVHTHRIPG